MVSLIPLTCPKCGGQLQIPPETSKCYCTYCGTQIIVDDGSTTIHVHNYDEAELKRIELERERLTREGDEQVAWSERRKKWRIALLAYFAIIFILSAISSPFKESAPAIYKVFSTLTGTFCIVGGIALFMQRPGKKKK